MSMCMCKRLFTTKYYLQFPTKSTTYNYLGTITLHNLFPIYSFGNIGTGLWKVRIGKGGYLNVPYDIYQSIKIQLKYCYKFQRDQFVTYVFPLYTLGYLII